MVRVSDGTSLPFDEAYPLAERVAGELKTHCQRIKAVGSLRRRRPRVGDIEFLVEPNLVEVDLFGTLQPDTEPLRVAMLQLGTWVKGGTRMMQVTDALGVPGLKLELYLVHPPAEWGSLLAIRTGPWELGRLAVSRMRDRGLRHLDGHVVRARTREAVPTPTEEAFFEAAGMETPPPHERDRIMERIKAARTAG